ncbi:hypothetical protein CEXT_266661 [Caerostris extrusa]|uniref:A-kinase anchor protein 17A n=1 Tax=Caerostris extrusa TaxID=172846 RepID=A0AAV4X3V3_CAEEX|nr:hypothetical protein CEXT_266661 [Caerostris extrusa]
MPFQTCLNIKEAVAFETSLGLYLKPISKIKVNVQLPKLNAPGQSISVWHIMEKIKETIKPDTFLYLKSLKITTNVIKFEGELETKSSCEKALVRLRAAGSLKVNGFTERLQIRAAHAACNGPTRHDWESFFRDAKGVNEMKPGERPDTIHLEELPVSWFAETGNSLHPNEKLLRKAFGTYGKIRRLEIPEKTATESNVFGKTSSLHNDLLFEVYIQYEEYVEFVIAMDALRGKRLLYKDQDGKVYSADIKVNFDRTNYLSDRCIKQRAASKQKAISASSLSKDIKQIQKDDQLPISKKIQCVMLNSKTEIMSASSSDMEICQTEAKHLLKELFHRAEVSERHKEKKNQVSSNILTLEEKKCQQISVKTSETSKEKDKLKSYDTKYIKEKHRHSDEKEISHRHKLVKKDKNHKEKYELNQERKEDKQIEKLKKYKDKHIHMRMEEKKIKDRLIQTLNQDQRNKEKLLEQERILKEKLLRKLKAREEEKLKEREKLRKELAGSKVLKSVLVNTNTSLYKREL